MAAGRSQVGKLVQTGPDSFEVVWGPATKNPSPTIRKSPKSQSLEEKAEGWFLSQDRTRIVDASGNLISEEVFIVKISHHNYYEQIYLRFLFEGSIWTAYTRKDPPLKLIAHPSNLPSLDCAVVRKKEKRTCRACKRKIPRGDSDLCSACAAKQKKKPACATPGCGKPLSKGNKSGLCVRCLRKEGFGDDRRVFNPFYGRLLEKGKSNGEK